MQFGTETSYFSVGILKLNQIQVIYAVRCSLNERIMRRTYPSVLSHVSF